MLFNSFIFIFAFLPVTLVVYFCLNRWGKFTLGKIWLVILSVVFYGYFNVAYLPLIVLSILINYGLSQCMLTSERKWLCTLCFWVGLLANLGVLGYYKYFDFFASNVNAAFGTSFMLHHLILPLGISFFTFQQLSYVIDSYKRTVPRYNIVDYALFVTFFPQLIAGPIVLHSEIVPQFANPENRHFRIENFSAGLYAFSIGLFKKTLIADTFAKVVGYGFDVAPALNTPETLFVMIGYMIQVYFDFSGYCDMALGLGRMFNINIPINFNSPLKSFNIKEYWTRWHMTLSRFFTQYVYFPLGGSRKGEFRTCLNLLLVFTISGLWHGATWACILWGALHGLASVIYRLSRKRYDAMHPALQWATNTSFVAVALLAFRAPNLDRTWYMLTRLFSSTFGPLSSSITKVFTLPFDLLSGSAPTLMLLAYVSAIVGLLGFRNTYELTTAFKPTWYRSLLCIVLLFASIMSLSGVTVFLYYNF